MSLLKVVGMSAEERQERRELDAECFRAVHAEIGAAIARLRASMEPPEVK